MSMSPRLLRPRATGFNPKSISGLAGWWDAGVSSSLAQNTNATGSVTATDDPIGYWGDLSGNGNHLTTTALNNRPFYKPGAINGQPCLAFDGANDTLQKAFTLAQPCWHFAVLKFNAAYSGGSPRCWDGAQVAVGLTRLDQTTMSVYAGPAYADANIVKATVTDAEMQSFAIWDVPLNGNQTRIYKAGVNRTNPSAQNTGSNSPSGLFLAVYANGFSSPANISIAEVLIYSRALSSPEARMVRSYLGKKYALSYA